MPNIKNEFGNIFISNEVVAKIAGSAANECYGIVGMASRNVTDGFVELLGRENLSKGIRLYKNNGLLILDLHIIVEIGTSINAIVETLINTVKYKLEQNLGFNVDKINIFVESVRVN